MTRTVAPIAVLLAAAVAPGVARAAEPAFALPLTTTLGFADEPAAPRPTPPAAEAFGTKGTDWLSVGAGVALVDTSTDINAYATYHLFIAADFEFNLTLGGWYFIQDDADDEAGINPALGFRWHFLNRQSWTLYADFGVGLLATTDDVPPGGTSFNFTPRAGIGATIALGDATSDPRLDLGVRWHHISNASQWGSDDNPSRDSVMFYAGVMFPF